MLEPPYMLYVIQASPGSEDREDLNSPGIIRFRTSPKSVVTQETNVYFALSQLLMKGLRWNVKDA